MSAAPTHADLVELAARWLRAERCVVVVTEMATAGREQADALGFRGDGQSILVECKASRADFRADASKPFRRQPEQGMGNLRFYAAPMGLLKPEEMPSGWGLLEPSKYSRGLARNYAAYGRPFADADVNRQAEIVVLLSAIRRSCPANVPGMSVKVYRWSSELPRATLGLCEPADGLALQPSLFSEAVEA